MNWVMSAQIKYKRPNSQMSKYFALVLLAVQPVCLDVIIRVKTLALDLASLSLAI